MFNVRIFYCRYRRKHSWTESFTSWIWNPSYDNLTEGINLWLHSIFSLYSNVMFLCFFKLSNLILDSTILNIAHFSWTTCWAVLRWVFVYESFAYLYSGNVTTFCSHIVIISETLQCLFSLLFIIILWHVYNTVLETKFW